MRYYPTHTHILERTRIVRRRLLPDGIRGEVLVKRNDTVGATDVVAWGTRPSDYVIIDVAGPLNLKPDDERLKEIIKFNVGQAIEAGTPLGEIIPINANPRNFAFSPLFTFFTFGTSKSCSSGTKVGMKLILVSEDS